MLFEYLSHYRTWFRNWVYILHCALWWAASYISITALCTFGNNPLEQVTGPLRLCSRILIHPGRQHTQFQESQSKQHDFTPLEKRLFSAHEIRSFSIPVVTLGCIWSNSLITEILKCIKLKIKQTSPKRCG